MSSSGNVEEKRTCSLRWSTLHSWEGRDVHNATPASPQDNNQIWDFITFLAVAQDAGIDFIPITWLRPSAIGTGGTAKVRQNYINLDTTFAFKIVQDAAWIDHIDEFHRLVEIKKVFKILISEISVLGHPSVRDHPNIISLLGICWDILPSGRVWPVLVFEEAPYRDLWNFKNTETGKQMGLETRLKLCADIATALKDLHQNGIIHGDLKPHNVLIFEDGHGEFVARVADFGYSTILKGNSGILMPSSGLWTAPEQIEGHPYAFCEAQKMDAYSFGMLCFWLIFGSENWRVDVDCAREENKEMEAVVHQLIARHASLQAEQRQYFRELFSLTLTKDPSQRCEKFDRLLGCLTMDKWKDLQKPEISVTDPMAVSPYFRIVPSVWQLVQADIRVRTYIVEAMKEHMDVCDDQAAQHYSFQLAWCLKLGLGAAKDDEYITYLRKSKCQESNLEEAIEKLEAGHGWKNEICSQLLSERYLVRPTLGDMFLEQGQQEIMIRGCKKELSDLQDALPRELEIVLFLKEELGAMFRERGLYKDSEELEVQVIETRKRVLGQEHPYTLASMTSLASIFWNQGR